MQRHMPYSISEVLATFLLTQATYARGPENQPLFEREVLSHIFPFSLPATVPQFIYFLNT